MSVCVHVCAWICAANLLMVSQGIYHKGLIHCGIANGSSLNLSCVVETRLCSGVGLASQQKGYPSIHFMQHEEDKSPEGAQDHAIVLDSPPITWPTWSKFLNFKSVIQCPMAR